MSALSELVERRDAATTELKEILRVAEGEERKELTEAEESRSDELVAEVRELDEKIDEETVKEERAAKLQRARAAIDAANRSGEKSVDAKVTNEPAVYGPDSRNSWYADQCYISAYPAHDLRRQAAEARLAEWSHQVERFIANGSKEGRKAEGMFREEFRKGNVRADDVLAEARARGSVGIEDKEVRTGITTGGGATASASGGGGAAFVSPVILIDDYAPWREYGRAFADQTNRQPLPDYGMEIYLPAVTGPAGVASQTEANGVNETDPTAGYLSTSLTTLAGQVTVSQQLLDRAGPGFSFDRMILDQLNRDYQPHVDVLALTAALASPGAVTYTGTFALTTTSGAGGFYSKVSGAKAAMRTLAGTVLNPTHLFLQPSRWEFIAAWADAQGRPVVVPDYAGPFNAAAAGSSNGDAGIEGYTGYRFDGLPVFTDANIPTPGTGADQALVCDMQEIYLFEGTPVTRTLPQTLGGNLQVIIQQYGYVAALPRYAKSTYAISGTGMTAITF